MLPSSYQIPTMCSVLISSKPYSMKKYLTAYSKKFTISLLHKNTMTGKPKKVNLVKMDDLDQCKTHFSQLLIELLTTKLIPYHANQ
ncbi:hypothetical protein DICVIV_12249 [Dictyocaulus viviparus]|uniref:Uncharacterized protein n=1 Tax=Dictyocaulus viviparus TaxID=29172 RepID=A0A0D8XHG6_DICVI|nr:hypothetical protein DICVIV_12249 [Dictyocaulus viviparus]